MIKPKNVILFAAFLFSIFQFSCKTKNKEVEVALNMEEVIQNSAEVKTSELVDNIEYVKLETTEKALIGNKWGNHILSIDDYFLISQRGIPLLIFNNTGKYIRSIGAIGRGPGEYNFDYQIAYNDINGCIYILNVTKKAIHCFDIQGKYVNDIKPKESIITFEYIGNGLFVGCLPNYVKDESLTYNYIVFNAKGETIRKLYIHGEAMSNNIGPDGRNYARVNQPEFTKSPSGVNIFTRQNDSIFKISEEGILSVPFTWDLGKYDAEYNFLDPSSEKPDNSKYIDVFSAIESERYWFVYFNQDNKPHRALFDKKTNEYNEIRPLNKPLFNDFDGGPSIWPDLNNFNGSISISLLDPIRLKKSLKNGDFKSLDLKYPDRNKDLIELINSLTENDNPIVRVVHMK